MFNKTNASVFHSKKNIIPSKNRITDGIALKNLQTEFSVHSSVIGNITENSMQNVINSQLFSRSSSVCTHKESINRQDKKNLINFKMNELPKLKKIKNEHEDLQQLFEKYYSTTFMKSLVEFMNKDWKQQQFVSQKKFKALISSISHKLNSLNQLIEDFLILEYHKYLPHQQKTIMSLLFKQSSKSNRQLEQVIEETMKSIPQENIIKQEGQLEQLKKKILEIYDPRHIYNNSFRQRFNLYYEEYTVKKNNLSTEINAKLVNQMNFITEIANYLQNYQKQVLKLKMQNQIIEKQKEHSQTLLSKKVNFQPIEIDYNRIGDMKQEATRQIYHDLEEKYVKFHQQQHQKNEKLILQLQKEKQQQKKELNTAKNTIDELKNKINDWINNIPKKISESTQVFMIPLKAPTQVIQSNNSLTNFLRNVSTPFSFNYLITGNLISLITIDRIIYDYEIIKNRTAFRSFQDFSIEWMIIRTGCKKIAQIFVKNLIFSLKQLKNRHKRFDIFHKICGFGALKKKNMQEDLQQVFFQTQLTWYYLIKLALMYRRKLNENPTGFQLFPPLQCQDVFKIPLRKTYELIQEFLSEQNFQKPQNLSQKIDYYAINQIQKYKSQDSKFQKEQLQEIHILREINFDIIAGFTIEFIAHQKCMVLEKLIRAIHTKQQQSNNLLGYSEFQAIYRKFYHEKRSKIELIYSRMCLVNQNNLLDIENLQPMVKLIIQDESLLRDSYDKFEALKSLVLAEKMTALKSYPQKKILNINSFESIRERYYHEFYDFYSTTLFLQEIYKIVKSLLRRKLKGILDKEVQIDKLIQLPNESESIQKINSQNDSNSQSQSQENSGKFQIKKMSEKKAQTLRDKVEEWTKIMVRVPHFSRKVLTIDQIVIHNMHRKEMIDATEFAWRTLRQIFVMISKQ